MKYSKWIVALIITLNSVFTYMVLQAFIQTSTEPTVLIGCWFGFTTGELWILANIKKTKIKENKDNENKLEK